MSKLIRTAAAVATADRRRHVYRLLRQRRRRRRHRRRQRSADLARRFRQTPRVEPDREASPHPDGPASADRPVREGQQDRHPAADIEKKEADIKAKYPPGQFEAILKQQGLTEADVQTILRQQLIIEKAVAPKVHVDRRRRQGVLRQEPRHARQARAGARAPHSRRR